MKAIPISKFIGQAENPSIGSGVAVGVDLYQRKQIARLSRKMVKRSGSTVTDLPIYKTQSVSGVLFQQGDSGIIYTSADNGTTWSVLPGNSGDDGKGLIVWEDYLFSCTPDDIDIYGPLSSGPSWTNSWWTSVGNDPLINEVGVNHGPFINLANNVLYFCNKNFIAYLQKVSGPTVPFDPTDPSTYLSSSTKFTMPAFYNAQCMGYFPPDTVAIAVKNTLNDSQADVVFWDGVQDTTAINVVSIPGATGPVTNLLTRNGILYAVTTNEAGVYTVNGTSAELIARLGLRMTNRSSGGAQYTTRVQPTVRVSSADFLGPELLIGICNFPSPVTQITGSGLFPYGVWAVNVENGSVYTKFPLSHTFINASYSVDHEMGTVCVTSNQRVIVGWQRSTTYGIDVLDDDDYITDSTTVFIESELYEVGTRSLPETLANIEYNLIEPLKEGQEISFYYRLSEASDYTVFHTDTASTLGSNVGNIIPTLPFDTSIYIQIAMTLKTGTGTDIINQTPQLTSAYLYY